MAPTDHLTILCITQEEPHSSRFLDGMSELSGLLEASFVVIDGLGAGYIEAILDAAIAACDDGYILRLDDDERCSKSMSRWLERREYLAADHWAFPRLNLWPDEYHAITNEPLYPDLQTRLSVKAKAGGRTRIHQGSPFGTGTVAPVEIEHHKYLVRSQNGRRAILTRYETLQAGAGSNFVPFSLPETIENLELMPVPW